MVDVKKIVPPSIFNEPEVFSISRFIQQDKSIKFLIIINEYISCPSDYAELIHELYTAKASDVFNIFLQSPGGQVSTGCLLADAIDDSLATVTTIVNGTCASITSIIMAAAPNIIIRPWSKLMYHMSSHMDWGNSTDIKEHAENLIEFMKYIITQSVDRNILTSEEYDQIINEKKDVYIPTDVLVERIGGSE